MVPLEAGKLFGFPHLWGDLDDFTVNRRGPQLSAASRACRIDHTAISGMFHAAGAYRRTETVTVNLAFRSTWCVWPTRRVSAGR